MGIYPPTSTFCGLRAISGGLDSQGLRQRAAVFTPSCLQHTEANATVIRVSPWRPLLHQAIDVCATPWNTGISILKGSKAHYLSSSGRTMMHVDKSHLLKIELLWLCPEESLQLDRTRCYCPHPSHALKMAPISRWF